MQDFMHSPQRMQVRRNSSSGSAPGGRMSCRFPCRGVNGALERESPRQPAGEGSEESPAGEIGPGEYSPIPGRGRRERRSPSAGRHRRRSGTGCIPESVLRAGPPRSPPWGSFFRQAMHRLHASLTRRRNSPSGEKQAQQGAQGAEIAAPEAGRKAAERNHAPQDHEGQRPSCNRQAGEPGRWERPIHPIARVRGRIRSSPRLRSATARG